MPSANDAIAAIIKMINVKSCQDSQRNLWKNDNIKSENNEHNWLLFNLSHFNQYQEAAAFLHRVCIWSKSLLSAR